MRPVAPNELWYVSYQGAPCLSSAPVSTRGETACCRRGLGSGQDWTPSKDARRDAQATYKMTCRYLTASAACLQRATALPHALTIRSVAAVLFSTRYTGEAHFSAAVSRTRRRRTDARTRCVASPSLTLKATHRGVFVSNFIASPPQRAQEAGAQTMKRTLSEECDGQGGCSHESPWAEKERDDRRWRQIKFPAALCVNGITGRRESVPQKLSLTLRRGRPLTTRTWILDSEFVATSLVAKIQ